MFWRILILMLTAAKIRPLPALGRADPYATPGPSLGRCHGTLRVR